LKAEAAAEQKDRGIIHFIKLRDWKGLLKRLFDHLVTWY
jgi:hypothetical protein